MLIISVLHALLVGSTYQFIASPSFLHLTITLRQEPNLYYVYFSVVYFLLLYFIIMFSELLSCYIFFTVS